jgi:predicted AAA+ superfamily ATPase
MIEKAPDRKGRSARPPKTDKRRNTFTDAKTRTKYSAEVKSAISKLLAECELPRDALPYTEEFDRLKEAFEKYQKTKIEDADFWRMLSSIGKGGGLARKGRKKKAPRTPTLTDSEQLEILRLMPDGIGNRDHLPYTDKFDAMHRRFVKLTGKKLDKHEFWRSVSRVAKRSRKPKPVYDTTPLGGLTLGLVQYLEENNPWWRAEPTRPQPTFRRWAFREVVDRLRTKLAPIVAVRGSRRVGKSVLQEQLIEDLLLMGRSDVSNKPVDPRRILRVVFEDAPSLGRLAEPIQAIVRWYEDNILGRTLNAASKAGQPAYLLFDEVQNLPKWSVQLKSLADHSDARIFVTGSSALRIAAGQDNLAGRMTTIELGPLRLTEVAGIRGLRSLPAYAPDARLEDWKQRDFWLELIVHGKKNAKIRDEAFRFFSELGGYPLCHSTTEQAVDKIRQQVIREVITKTIEHDPGHRPHMPALDSAFVREVFRMVCRYAGQAVRPKRFADEIQAVLGTAVPMAKVTEAIDFLADSLLLYRVMPLEMLSKKGGHAPPKLCLCDHFVRNGVLQETVPIEPGALRECDEAVSGQAGHLVESVLGYFLKGIPGVELAWFPARGNGQEPEIDLVLTIGTGRIPVEIKYRREAAEKRDLAGIRTFCEKPAYAAEFGLVITQTSEGPIGDKAIAVPASTFLLIR